MFGADYAVEIEMEYGVLKVPEGMSYQEFCDKIKAAFASVGIRPEHIGLRSATMGGYAKGRLYGTAVVRLDQSD